MPRTKVLNVAEKPSVAKELAKILSRNSARQRQSQTQWNKIWEFQNCNIMGQDVDMVVTSVTGHLMELEFIAPYGNNWSRCSPKDLFTVPVVKSVKKDNERLERQLRDEARKANWLVLWLDCDREGENIAYEVLEVCQKANRNLRVLRARFSALTRGEILQTVQQLREPDRNASMAVDARQEIDLRLGAAFTRFQTRQLQPKFEGLSDTVISYGPCQFPTLGFVVDRFLRRQNFVSEPFWVIKLEYREGHDTDHHDDEEDDSNDGDDDGEGGGGAGGDDDDDDDDDDGEEDRGEGESGWDGAANGFRRKRRKKQAGAGGEKSSKKKSAEGIATASFLWRRQRVFSHEIGLLALSFCVEDGTAVVTSVSGRRTTKRKPVPLSTVELQKRASRFCRITSERTMNAAEKLYQRGIISYPRTETETFKPDHDLRGMIQIFNGHGDYGGYARLLTEGGGLAQPRRGPGDDQAHPPIHPTQSVEPGTLLNDDERKVYNLVTRHFLACCSQDAVGHQTTVNVDCGGEQFHTEG